VAEKLAIYDRDKAREGKKVWTPKGARNKIQPADIIALGDARKKVRTPKDHQGARNKIQPADMPPGDARKKQTPKDHQGARNKIQPADIMPLGDARKKVRTPRELEHTVKNWRQMEKKV